MSKAFHDVVRDASALSDQERAQLAGLLIDSLDTATEPGAEAAWDVEIERRAREIDGGKVRPVSWADVRRRLLDRVDAR